MYIATFYSYKGGVGRSMALVNVGTELAKRGKKVLLVDFDLEAPGLPTFDILKPTKPVPGIVDYVTDYNATGHAPRVGDYVYRCKDAAAEQGEIWVMPAGLQDGAYERRLHGINWQRLYSAENGYLLFEDLKAQWERDIRPDYVLLDSRTGHTDMGGICTRQLPDAVVLLFFPNEQNLRGLERIVADIRLESTGNLRKPIQLHFVTANVPDLDDEHRILNERRQQFRTLLGYRRTAAVIHHYPSLALINQVVFTLERPASRLAKEYRVLVDAIVQCNTADRDGSLAYLKDLVTRPERRDRLTDRERVIAIRSAHDADGEVLYWLGRFYESEGRWSEALELYSAAERQEYQKGELFGRRAQLYRLVGETEHALEMANRLLACSDVTFLDVRVAVQILRVSEPAALQAVPDCAAVRSLTFDDRCHLAEELLRPASRKIALRFADSLFIEAAAQTSSREHDLNSLVLCLIAAGRYGDAKHLVTAEDPNPGRLDQLFAFNYAMADWAETGRPPVIFFQRVLELDQIKPAETRTPNYAQCLAIAAWAVGENAAATAFALEARRLLKVYPQLQRQFSSWRYLNVSTEEFEDDMKQVDRLLEGEKLVPTFMQTERQDAPVV